MSENLQRIGEKIAFVVQVAQQALVAQQLTREELEAFLSYVRRQDTTLPIFDPTAYRQVQRDGSLEKAQYRVKVLLDLLAIPVPEELRALIEQPAITQAAAEKRLKVIFWAADGPGAETIAAASPGVLTQREGE